MVFLQIILNLPPMHCFVKTSTVFIAVLFWGCATSQSPGDIAGQGPEGEKAPILFDDTREVNWGSEFELVEIVSDLDGHRQKAFFHKSKSDKPMPLVVSLHTWSGDYSQKDPIAKLAADRDFNYIHPDFRGANNTRDACCSELAMEDIDAAITFALANARVDESRIYVIGVSGGGYATLSTFMKSRHPVRKFSAWVPITDLIAWHGESRIRGNKYANDILACTGSTGEVLDEETARAKSPMYWETPAEKLSSAEVFIYAGVYDGIQGSVPITHSINFYNKLLGDLSVTDSAKYVSDREKLRLLEFRKPLGDFGQIAGRDICLVKEYGNIKLLVFEGNHEMLTEYAFEELVEE